MTYTVIRSNEGEMICNYESMLSHVQTMLLNPFYNNNNNNSKLRITTTSDGRGHEKCSPLFLGYVAIEPLTKTCE